MVVDIMNKVNYHEPLTNSMKSTVKTIALIGAVIGQLLFGSVADMIGRRKIFIVTCVLVIAGALLSATVQDSSGSFGIYSQLCVWRFLLGVGVGGEYPLSASITSESNNGYSKQKNLALVFSMQGFGALLCTIVLVIVTNVFENDYDTQWRIALGMGSVPMIFAFYFRWKMHESSTWDVAHVQQQGGGNQTLRSYIILGAAYVNQTIQENPRLLLGTAGSWFILDVVFYANSLFSGQITKLMQFGTSVKAEAIAQLILQVSK